MIKVPIPIEITDFSTKWGLVVVLNKDQSMNRQYRITAEEADAVHRSNNVLPPRCSREEWASGLVTVFSRPCNPGQAVVNPDGTLMVNHGVVEMNGRVHVAVSSFKADEWEYFRKNRTIYVGADKASRIINDLSLIGVV